MFAANFLKTNIWWAATLHGSGYQCQHITEHLLREHKYTPSQVILQIHTGTQ